MWINIEVVSGSEAAIYLPKALVNRLDEEIDISFGKKHAAVRVFTDKELNMKEKNTFENPMKVRMTSKLIYKLSLPETLTYQMRYDSSSMIIGPAIGLLLGGYNYCYSPLHMEKYSDRFGVYEKIGGLIYAFSYKSIDWDKELVYGLYYDNKETRWKYGVFPLPAVIYRRDFHTDPKVEKKLADAVDGKMFNSWRFTKFYLYKYVKQSRKLSKYLPTTELSKNNEQVIKFIEQNNDVILKPTHLSRGRGICIINKEDDGYKVSDYRKKEAVEIKLKDKNALKDFFDKNNDFFSKYLIQRHLKLAKIDGASFDIRVVMQKEQINEWKCTGIECRVAAKKTLVTNISRGGYALTLDEALKGAFPDDEEGQGRIKEQIQMLCRKLCRSLEDTGHHFAEFGMDIAADEDGNLWIIEVNVFPSFKGFKEMDYETYLDIRHTPILYAAHLTGF
jgi:glutathione synthase/RimK-type ligase-like ATP-grasp enzyme